MEKQNAREKKDLRLVMGGGPKPLPTFRNNEKIGDIVDLILKDHGPLKGFIQKLKDLKITKVEKLETLDKFVNHLLSHAKAEQQSLYFAMKENARLKLLGFEGETEHWVAEQLAQKINATPGDDEWNAKVKVLAESVEHHLQEEETDVLPKVRSLLDTSARAAIGKEYLSLKQDYDLVLTSPQTKRAKPTTMN